MQKPGCGKTCLLVAATIAGDEQDGDPRELDELEMVVNLLPAFMIEKEAIFGGGGCVGGRRQGDVGRVHVGHDAASGEGVVKAEKANNAYPKGGCNHNQQAGLEPGLAHLHHQQGAPALGLLSKWAEGCGLISDRSPTICLSAERSQEREMQRMT